MDSDSENMAPDLDTFSFPYHVSILGAPVDGSIVNAADSHILEIQQIMQPNENNGGNILAVVTFPKDSDNGRACDGKLWHDVHIRMSSERLMDLGSSKINKLLQSSLNPDRQRRIRRRLGLALLPPGIEYVVDFSPPAEGVELADLTAALWLPKTIKLWFLSGHFLPADSLADSPFDFQKRPLGDKAVGAIMTLGHDDICKHGSCLHDLSCWAVNRQVPGIVEENPNDLVSVHMPSWRKIDDYCQTRHRGAIIRVLRAINGDDLLLNSASRMWTVAQVAIHLEVPHVVRDSVAQWFIAAPNTKFIEIAPEKAFQLAYALKIPSVVIPAFRILVSEHAIDYASAGPMRGLPPHSWIQRKRDDYGDFPSDPIEYASRAFMERITGLFDAINSDTVFDYFNLNLGIEIPGWATLQRISPMIPQGSPFDDSFKKLKKALVSVFQRNVRDALSNSTVSANPSRLGRLCEAQRGHYVPAHERLPLPYLWSNLNNHQKALTSFFWHKLKEQIAREKFAVAMYQGRRLWFLLEDFKGHLEKALAAGTIDAEVLTLFNTRNGAYCQFSLYRFADDIKYAIDTLSNRLLDRGHRGPSGALDRESHDYTIPFYLSDHLLLGLDDKELDFLPLWAGGLDDGTGGVFQDVVPPTEMGPSEPGPAYHTGHTVATDAATTMTGDTSTLAPSDLGFDALDIHSVAGGTSVVGGSVDAQRSVTTTTAGPASGVASVSDASSEAFSLVGDEASARGGGDDAEWSDVGSVTGAGLVGGGAPAATGGSFAGVFGSASSGGGSGGDRDRVSVDGFGLDLDDEEMGDFDDDDDDTSTLGGSEYDFV